MNEIHYALLKIDCNKLHMKDSHHSFRRAKLEQIRRNTHLSKVDFEIFFIILSFIVIDRISNVPKKIIQMIIVNNSEQHRGENKLSTDTPAQKKFLVLHLLMKKQLTEQQFSR